MQIAEPDHKIEELLKSHIQIRAIKRHIILGTQKVFAVNLLS